MEGLVDEVSSRFNVNLHPFQRECLMHVLDKKDVFVSVPTGGGKTLCYAFLPELFNSLEAVKDSIILVVSPLTSLMSNQCARLQDMGLTSAFIGEGQSNPAVKQGVRDGKYSIVFVCPEALAPGSTWKSILTSHAYVKRVKAVIVDEAHCISQWGDGFRPDYRKIGDLRAIYSSCTPFVALTATATMTIRKDIEECLAMESPSLISLPSTRTNITYCVVKTSPGDVDCMKWIITGLILEGDDFPKIIIYCRNVKSVATLYSVLKNNLGEALYSINDDSYKNRRIAMFHRATAPNNKEHVLQEFPKKESAIRIVIATSAFGLGIDIPDVNIVVNFGCPRTVEGYAQETGRAGRKGQEAFALLYFQPHNAHIKMTDSVMVKMCKKETCVRQSLFDHFKLSKEGDNNCSEPVSLCRCCNICAQSCQCGDCVVYPWNTHVSDTDILISLHACDIEREVNMEKLPLLRLNLEDFVKGMELDSDYVVTHFHNPTLFHGLSQKMIDTVVNNCHHILEHVDLIQETGIDDPYLVNEIMELIEEIFPSPI